MTEKKRQAALTLDALTKTVRLHEHHIEQLGGVVYFRPLPTAFVLDNTLDKKLDQQSIREQNDNLQRTMVAAVCDAAGEPIFPDVAALNDLPIDIYNSISTGLVEFMNPAIKTTEGKAQTATTGTGATTGDSSTVSPAS